jgi:hypothetical protein
MKFSGYNIFSCPSTDENHPKIKYTIFDRPHN